MAAARGRLHLVAEGPWTHRRRLRAADGVEIGYWLRPANQRAAPLLLLLHGGASNHTRWSEFAATTRLAGHVHLLAPDLRGNGESMTRGRLGLGVWSRDVAAILDAEGRERAWLAGHSLGAQIALRFAADHPRRCAGLVLVDPVFESALTGRRRALARHRWLVAAAAAVVRVANRAGIRRRRFPSRDLRELDRETRAALRDADSREEIVRRYSALGPILSHMPTANYLAQLLATVAPVPPPADPGLPVLVVVSTGGRFADNAAKQAELERFPGAVMAAVDCEHWPLTERPDEVRRAIDDFLFSRVAPGCGKLAAVWETRSTGDSE